MPIRTIVTAARVQLASVKVALARTGDGNGVSVLPIDSLVARLAGGFSRLPTEEEVLAGVGRILEDTDKGLLGDLAAIADLPGVRATLTASLWKAWRANLDLASVADCHPRLSVMASIEEELVSHLPAGVLLPAALAEKAISRLAHAPALLGEVALLRQADIDPCWRQVICRLTEQVPVTWDSRNQETPEWVYASGCELETSESANPAVTAFSCANGRHEVVEAMRWARRLISTGEARPQDIAFASASTAQFDEFVQAAADETLIPVHFAHGRAALETPGGQTAAAMADVLLRGLTQERVRRLVSRLTQKGGPLEALPDGWANLVLPAGAPLDTAKRWEDALAGDEKTEVRTRLEPLIADLARGAEGAEDCGHWLAGPARALWRRALERVPAEALERELRLLRMVDDTEPEAAIAWMSANTLATCPRPFVWLLGLNTQAWPRLAAEDPFLPSRVLATIGASADPNARLTETSVTEADRRAFRTVMRATKHQVARSFSRREATGRLLGVSPLVAGHEAVHLQRTRIPEHAMSEPDRLMARPADFAKGAVAASAAQCWRDWQSPDVTAHDGLVSQADHPALMAALGKPQSASSLTMMLRNPLGWMWRHALGMKEPQSDEPSFQLDAKQFGILLHSVLDAAVLSLTAKDGTVVDDRFQILQAVEASVLEVAAVWETEQTLPPTPLWQGNLAQVRAMANNAMLAPVAGMQRARTYSEVPFGRESKDGPAPWDPSVEVSIPGVDLSLQGRIDRLDVTLDDKAARVVDFKSGSYREGIVLRGGRELQRCLYAYAVHALLGAGVEVEAALFYPRRDTVAETMDAADYGHVERLEDPSGTLERLSGALQVAVGHVRAGRTLPGIAAGARVADTRAEKGNAKNESDDLAFALPVVPGTTLEPKKRAAQAAFGPEFTAFWEEV